jgi:hypothetical protein
MLLRELYDIHEERDGVTVNRDLNPKLWKSGELKSEVREKLVKIADSFERFIGIDLDIVDLTLTGSNANYTWTPYSDLDLHLMIKGEITDAMRELFNAKKALYNDQHDIKIKGIPVEVYVQGTEEEHHSTGVYSIDTDQWLAKPEKQEPDVDDDAIQAKLSSTLHDIQLALANNDLDDLRTVKDRLTNMRKAGLARTGEWSTENQVFKQLRNLGVIEEIVEKIQELEDQELSLEQQTPPLD